MPTLKQFEALQMVAQADSFQRAADRLNATQSAVSKRIRELEAELGIELFDRSQRKNQLTPKGRRILQLGEEMLALRDEAVAVAHSQAQRIRDLRFGITELTAMTWLPAFVSKMRAAYPSTNLEPEVEQSVTLFDRVSAGELDFAVVPDCFATGELQKVTLASVRNAWMCSPALPIGTGPMSMDALAEFNILTQGGSSGYGRVFNAWMKEHGIDPKRLITSNSVIASVGLTLSAFGISYLPADCFSSLVTQGKLKVVESDPSLPNLNYVLIFRAREPRFIVESVSEIALSTCDFTHPIKWA